MKQVRWFDRKFDFSSKQNVFPAIVVRLEGTPLRLNDKISRISAKRLVTKANGQWSIQENVGHLTDLELLWQGRLEDILAGKKYLRTTDLENKQTDQAQHNEQDIDTLLTSFEHLRRQTLAYLKQLSTEEVFKYALHPRLNTPMRTMDLFLFVAEHDDHHLARISELAILNS